MPRRFLNRFATGGCDVPAMDDHAATPVASSPAAALEAAADRTALAAILDARGRQREARETLRHALPMLEEVLGAEHFEVGRALETLAGMFLRAGQHADAVALYRRAHAIFERTLGSEDARTAACRTNLDKALAGSDQ